jgi:large subunit ribosomal protein L2
MKTIKLNPINNSSRQTVLLKKALLIKNSKIFKSLKRNVNRKFGKGKFCGKTTSWHKQRGAKTLYRDTNQNYSNYKSLLIGSSYNPNKNTFNSILFDLDRKVFLNETHIKNTYAGTLLEKRTKTTDFKLGYKLELKEIPTGALICDINSGFTNKTKYIKTAGAFGQIIQKDKKKAVVKLPSNKKVELPVNWTATIGTISNEIFINNVIGKAGRNRNNGRRPVVRGIAMNPVDHPHGGRTNGGRPSVTPWGLPTKSKFKLKKRKKKILKLYV